MFVYACDQGHEACAKVQFGNTPNHILNRTNGRVVIIRRVKSLFFRSGSRKGDSRLLAVTPIMLGQMTRP